MTASFPISIEELAAKLNIGFKGDGKKIIHGLKDLLSLQLNEDVDDQSLYFVEAAKFLKKFPQLSQKGIILTSQSLAGNFNHALIVADNQSRLKFIEMLGLFEKPRHSFAGISNQAYIAPDAKLGQNVTIMPFAVVSSGAQIGDNCVLYPHVVIEDCAVVGNDTVLHSGSVIGSHCVVGSHCIFFANSVVGADGFGYHDQEKKRYKVPQIGNVVVGDFVEVGACSTIDRATINSTVIGDFTKIDNQVQIGHNCQVGQYVYVAGNAGISGSVIIEDFVTIAGQAGLADHVRVGEGAVVMALTGINTDVEKKSIVFGIPARPIKEIAKINGALPHLPELLKRVRAIEEKSTQEKSS